MAGFLIVVPIYLAVLLLLKAMKSVVSLVKPIAPARPRLRSRRDAPIASVRARDLHPDRHSRPHRNGKGHPRAAGKTLFERIPGYALIRSLTQQLAGSSRERSLEAGVR